MQTGYAILMTMREFDWSASFPGLVSIRDIKRVGAKYGGQPVTDVYSAGCYEEPMTGDYVAGRRDHEMGLIFLTHEWSGSNIFNGPGLQSQIVFTIE